MGKLTLMFVLAAILGGSMLALSTRTLSSLTSRDQSEGQADLLARQIAESGQNLALTAMMGEDGFNDPAISSRDYDGGRFEVAYAGAADRQTATVTVTGRYGGAAHTIEGAYEFDPMDFPGPIWLDVPYATSTVTGTPSVTGGPRDLPVSFDRRSYDAAGFGADLPLSTLTNDFNADFPNAAGSGFSMPSAGAWAGGSAPILEDLNVSDAEGIYQAAIAAMTGTDRSFGALSVGNAQTWNGTTRITRVRGNLTVRSGGRVTGEGVLVVEGGLVVQPGGTLRWTGLVVVRAAQQVLPVTLSGTVAITGALVVKQEATPPGGHLDVTVWRDPNGLSSPQGANQVLPWAGTPGAFPWTQHNHRFDLEHASGRHVYLRTSGGPSVHEREMQFSAALAAAGSDPVYLEFSNQGEHGYARYRLGVQGEPAMTGTVRDGFPAAFRAAGNVYRSQVFAANRLRDFDIDVQSLRALKDRFDGSGCDQWPFCIGDDWNRGGALRVRLVRASGARVLHESAYYWHMRGDEVAAHEAEMAAWRATVASGTGFGTALTMGGNVTIGFALTPLVRLAPRLGFDGNEVILRNTTTRHTTTADARAARSGSSGSGSSNSGSSNSGSSNSGSSGSGSSGSGSPAPSPAPAPTPVPTNPMAPSPTASVVVCHSGSPLTITGATLLSHVLHDDQVGGCPDVPPAAGSLEDIVICHSGGSIAITALQYPTHIGHGDTYGSCP